MLKNPENIVKIASKGSLPAYFLENVGNFGLFLAKF
jgi:hypothetical protein